MRVWLLVALVALLLVPAANADVIWTTQVGPGNYDIDVLVDYFSQSGYPSIPYGGTMHPSTYTPGTLELRLIIDGSVQFSTQMSTELDLAGRLYPVSASYNGWVIATVAIESCITPDVTEWVSDDPEHFEMATVTGDAYIDGITIESTPPLPEPSGIVALLGGLAGMAGLLRRRTR